jgi:hypothetical protein
MDTKFLKTKDQRLLDEEIERLIQRLKNEDPSTKEYAIISDNLRVLCESREKKNPGLIYTDTLLSIGANLIGLILILNFERTGVITSKAMSFLRRRE